MDLIVAGSVIGFFVIGLVILSALAWWLDPTRIIKEEQYKQYARSRPRVSVPTEVLTPVLPGELEGDRDQGRALSPFGVASRRGFNCHRCGEWGYLVIYDGIGGHPPFFCSSYCLNRYLGDRGDRDAAIKADAFDRFNGRSRGRGF